MLGTLPLHIMGNIADHTYPEDRRSLLLTSWQLYDGSVPAHWREISIAPPLPQSLPLAMQVSARARREEFFKTSTTLSRLGKYVRNIKISDTGIARDEWELILRSCPNLTHVAFDYGRIEQYDFPASYPVFVLETLAHSPLLTTLDLTGFGLHGDDTVRAVSICNALGQLTQLRTLIAGSPAATVFSTDFLPLLPQLHKVVWTTRWHNFVPNFSSSTLEIRIKQVEEESDQIEPSQRIELFQRIGKRLRGLDAWYDMDVTFLKALLNLAPGLDTLKMVGISVNPLGTAEWEEELATLHRLGDSLRVQKFRFQADNDIIPNSQVQQVLTALLRGSTALESFVFWWVDSMEPLDLRLSDIFSSSSCLSNLVLEGLGVERANIIQLVKRSQKTLRRLSFDSCQNVSIDLLKEIFEAAPFVERFSLDGCMDELEWTVFRSLPRLEKLGIVACLTPPATLGQDVCNLRHLHLRFPVKFLPDYIGLFKTMRRLNTVSLRIRNDCTYRNYTLIRSDVEKHLLGQHKCFHDREQWVQYFPLLIELLEVNEAIQILKVSYVDITVADVLLPSE